MCMCVSHSVMSNSLQPHGPQLTRLLCPWNSPDKSTCSWQPFPSPGIFLTQGSNPSLPYCRQIIYSLSHQGSNYYSIHNVTEHLCDRHCFTCIISFNPHNYEIDLNIKSCFQMRTLKLKKIKKLTHLYMVSIQTWTI